MAHCTLDRYSLATHESLHHKWMGKSLNLRASANYVQFVADGPKMSWPKVQGQRRYVHGN